MQMALIANANGTPQSIDFRWFHRFSRTYRFLLDANKHDPVTFFEDLFLESVRQSGALLIAMDVCYPGLCASRREFASVPPIYKRGALRNDRLNYRSDHRDCHIRRRDGTHHFRKSASHHRRARWRGSSNPFGGSYLR